MDSSRNKLTTNMPLRVLICWILSVSAQSPPNQNNNDITSDITGESSHQFRGYYKRDNSLIKPYTASGTDIPFWNIQGSTFVTPQFIRLTGDEQSRAGAIWNTQPNNARDWEVSISFKVSGSTGDLFGDGLAIWYVSEPNQMGPVFGGKDYFRGLGVFLDTYSNHNGKHKHQHPLISAMVSDGSLHYDHDKDGTHTQLGGEDASCSAKFRNKDYETNILIRYIDDTLSIYTDIEGKGVWEKCLSVKNVYLPSGYYFGVSAATGELSDAHDIISFKTFEQDFNKPERLGEPDSRNVIPHAEVFSSPRDHSDDVRPSKLGWFGTVVLVIIGAIIVLSAVAFVLFYLQKKNELRRKRFY